MYIYESHMGGLFAADEPLTFDECYCETCGDYDRLIGHANTREEALKLLKDDSWDDDCDDDDWEIPWEKDYVEKFLNKNFSEDYRE